MRFTHFSLPLVLLGALVSQTLAAEIETVGPVHKLDLLTVEADRVPLRKLPLNRRLLQARFGAAAAVEGDYIYVVGGSSSSGTPLDDIERFDTRTNTSERFAKLHIGRRNHRAVVAHGKLYVLGGYSLWSQNGTGLFEPSVEVIDLGNRGVSLAAPMPVPKANFACARADGKIYVIGGAIHKGFSILHTNSVEVYDIASGKWEPGVRMPTPRMAVAAEVTGFIVVAGGFKGRSDVDEVEVFIPAEQCWRILPKLHEKANPTAAALAGHYLFLFTERNLVAYDLTTKTSVSHQFDYAPAHDNTSVVLRDRIYVIGGHRTPVTIGPDELFPRVSLKHQDPNVGVFAPANDSGENPLADIFDGGKMDATDEIQVFELRSVHPSGAQ